MKSIDSLLSLLVVLEVDETETLALALLVNLDDSGGNSTVLLKESNELFLSDLSVEVLDVDVGELSPHLLDLGLTLLWSG